MFYRWTHSEDNKVIEVSRKMEYRDVPPTDDELDAAGYQPEDAIFMERRPEAPVISKRHIPATGRSRLESNGAFKDLREADKLESESFDMGLHDRDEINREIDLLKGLEPDD